MLRVFQVNVGLFLSLREDVQPSQRYVCWGTRDSGSLEGTQWTLARRRGRHGVEVITTNLGWSCSYSWKAVEYVKILESSGPFWEESNKTSACTHPSLPLSLPPPPPFPPPSLPLSLPLPLPPSPPPPPPPHLPLPPGCLTCRKRCAVACV